MHWAKQSLASLRFPSLSNCAAFFRFKSLLLQTQDYLGSDNCLIDNFIINACQKRVFRHSTALIKILSKWSLYSQVIWYELSQLPRTHSANLYGPAGSGINSARLSQDCSGWACVQLGLGSGAPVQIMKISSLSIFGHSYD